MQLFRRLWGRGEVTPPPEPSTTVYVWHSHHVTRVFFEDFISSQEQWLLLKQRFAEMALNGEIPGAKLPGAGQGPLACVRVRPNYVAIDRDPIYNALAETIILDVLANLFYWNLGSLTILRINSRNEYEEMYKRRWMANMERPRGPQVDWMLGRSEYRDFRRPF